MKRLDSLTSLRFFAAFAVVVGHLTGRLALGHAGVSFFFVLSGFVLTWGYRPEPARAFWRRRFARVYPMHLLTWFVAVPVLLLTAPGSLHPGRAVEALLLVQTWTPHDGVYFGMNAVSWSLACEAFFYAMFPLVAPRIVRLPRRTLWLLVVVVPVTQATVMQVASHSAVSAEWFMYVFPPYRFCEFVAGITLAALLRSGVRVPVRRPVAVGTVGVVLGGIVYLSTRGVSLPAPVTALTLLPFVLVAIGACATADAAGVRSVLHRRWLVTLGDWSFALYITHHLLLRVMLWAVGPFTFAQGVLFAVAAVLLAGVCFRNVERPLERALRSGHPGHAAEEVVANGELVGVAP